MILAELEIYHSRPIAPTRRVALGRLNLPIDPPPGPGGLLLASVVGAYVGRIDPELLEDLEGLCWQVEHGRRIAQPRLRHRFQRDKVGLTRSRHRLVRRAGKTTLDLHDVHGAPAQQVLGAVYAAGRFTPYHRGEVFALVRKAMLWRGGTDERLLEFLTSKVPESPLAVLNGTDPTTWALDVLGFPEATDAPEAAEVRQRFRLLLRAAHPDHGGAATDAARRIAELTEARRILLAG